jgi:hypothetical protein
MKRLSLLFLSLFILGLISTTALFGQAVGDYQSAGSGNWGTAATWNTWNGSGWVGASVAPDSTNLTVGVNVVTILSPNNVTVAAEVGVRNVTVNQGATVTVNGTPVVLHITQGYLQVNGTLTLTGTGLATNTPSVVNVSNTIPGTTTIGSTGIVNYNQTLTTTLKGALPTATWTAGSTLNVNSTGGPAATGFNAGSGQDFSNINWTCPLMTANFGMGFGKVDLITGDVIPNNVSGSIKIYDTHLGRVQFFGGSNGHLNIMGDLVVSNSMTPTNTVGSANVTASGSSSGTLDTINVYGKVDVNTTGDFSVSRGSQGGIGTSIWNFFNDVKIIAGSLNNSNANQDSARFIFKKQGTQNLTLTTTFAAFLKPGFNGNCFPMEVDAGATVVCQSTVNVTSLSLNGGIIKSSSANPLVMGCWNTSTSSLTSGSITPWAPGSATSFVNGPMAYLYATAAGSTTKTYPIGKDTTYRPLTLSLTQTAATASTYTAEMFNSAPVANTNPGTLNLVSIARYYIISETGGGSAFTAGSLLLNYGISDGVTDPTNLRIAQGPAAGGGTWVDLGGSGTGTPYGSITSAVPFTDLTTNTVFTLANNTGGTNPLPVELSSFTVNNNGRNTQLNWETKTEVNSNKFVIERALVNTKDAAVTWMSIGTIVASGTSNSSKNYSYTEKNLQAGKYQYRLKMIDNDGSYKYSKVVETEIALPKNFELSQNYPNPFNPSTKIDYQVPVDSKVILEVYNIAGQKVNDLVNSDQSAGYYTVDFGSSSVKLSSGVYIYRIVARDKATGNNFSSIKKMMLLK